MKQIDLNYYPGWVRKAITFTIDDGNLKLDRKFLDITEPAGLRGTFNLCTPLKRGTHEDYKRFYHGYEIANHCRFHAYPFTPQTTHPLCEDPWNPETADKEKIYRTEIEGLYHVYTYAWTNLASDEFYMDCVKSCQEELESIFGKGSIRGYVWPCGAQKNDVVFDALKAFGFQSIRKTGNVKDSTGFALPADRAAWSYNSNYTDLTEMARAYEAYPDDGELKFFAFGVHSHDFEKADRWDVLIDFCSRYGNRPEDFWYASVGEIFDYQDAVSAVQITEDAIINDSDVDLCIKIDGVRTSLFAHSRIVLAD